MKEEDLDRIQQRSRLQIAEAEYIGDKTAKVEAILSAAEGEGAPYKLLSAMHERHLRTFLIEHWEQIAEINDPEGSGYSTDYIDYDVHTFQLFILWAWAHI